MKFAFSTPGSNLSPEEIAATAKKHGYDGVELSFPTTVTAAFKAIDISVACLAGAAGYTGDRPKDDERADHVRSLIDWGCDIGCPLVMLTESAISSGKSRPDSGVALGDWLLPLADYAADHAVILALENSHSLRSAKETWSILDRLNHPALGCCLDVYTAARLGESPQVTVPMLNSKIVYVTVRQAKDLAQPTGASNLSDGVVPIKTTIARLRGIGYIGWVSVNGLGTGRPLEEDLSQAIVFLRDWSTPPDRPKPRAKAAP